MSKPKVHHSTFYYLNPFVWIRELFSYLMTFFLLFDRFFAIFFGCFIFLFIAFFFYDRYSNFTYGNDNNSKTSYFKVGFFNDNQKYTSPLTQNNNNLSKKLSVFYASKIQSQEKTETKKDSDQPKAEQPKKNDQNRRADLNPNTAENQIAVKSYQEQWATRPYKSIQKEVRRRTSRKRK